MIVRTPWRAAAPPPYDSGHGPAGKKVARGAMPGFLSQESAWYTMDYESFKTKYALTLNPQQEAAVKQADGPVLLLAVPGSGKTAVLVARLGYLLYCHAVPPGNILTMTYTVAATRDMRARFAQLFGPEAADSLEFRTINGLSARIIRHYERTEGRQAFSLVSDDGALSRLVGEIYRATTGSFAADSDIKAVRTLITYAKNMRLTGSALDALKLDGTDFAPIYLGYCEALRERQWMDFDDQMVYAYEILRRHPHILAYFQDKYRYLCVDEAQDTSKIQHLLIRLLAQKHQNLFMVGDEDQSIYGFRAAYPQALMEFTHIYPQAKVLMMEKNYRSTGQIVSLADRFIQANQNRHPKRMVSEREAGPDVAQIWVYDQKAQYAYLAKVAQNCPVETAILYRDNDCALPVIDMLSRRGIGYRCRQVESGFFSHFIVRDLTGIIRFAYQRDDAALFLQLYYKLGAGITKEAALAAADKSQTQGGAILAHLQEDARLSPWSRAQVKRIQTHLDNLKTESAAKAVYRMVHFMGYGDYLTQRGADQNKVQILLALAAQTDRPLALLDRLDELLSIVEGGSSDPSSKFILSTIHSSKGLEYERVILMDVRDGILPKTSPDSPAKPTVEEVEALEEERRLFYVAMTRAKQELHLFRYKKEDLTSAFSQTLFPSQPKPAPKVQMAAPRPKPGYTTSRDVSTLADGLTIGAAVVHKVFGPGRIESRSGAIASILFEDGAVKRLDLTTALRQSLLTPGSPSDN